ncbi:UDP binding domain-containing protein [Lentimicrobium sp.]|uniref:nucleotide sugar dehydrogenase n=1 Tax=Lentimicrobium sp. TaxID=2034841 RepID=UPI002CF31B45|nr:UDP binding domain-containing protein [Lentimicrobium sp.]HPF65098.1 UDP binding domain-containing protein [Lentimicrobium sp.]HPR26192.1 UDP binding domain-containing protein [Lentimicrobium sp.]
MATEIRYSVNPSGEKFPIPQERDYELEKQRIGRLVETARVEGKEIVVVMGVGFVGAVMAAIVADTVDAAGNPSKFVIGCQRPSQRSYWKIPMLNRGESPVKAEDPEVDRIIRRCVTDRKTLTASFNSDVLEFADVVVVDVQCDFSKQDLGYMKSGEADMAALEATLKTIGEKIPPHCLTLIETTVAPGTTEFVAWPILKKAFAKRGIESVPLLAHSFERVMPGREYVSSIRDFWRVCSGCESEARKRVEKFLHEVLNTKDFPLTVMDRPIESETTKIVENSYRATILAYLNEWSLFAERNGVDLIKVINAIKMRPTHSNIIFPGPGVGGYCLPKDGGLGYWAYRHILGFEDGDEVFKITPTAIDINDTRSLHVAELTRDALRNMARYIAGAEVVLCGASYRQDVGDTRYSGSEMVVRKLTEMGAEVRIHDPYVEHWYELESQDTYPAPGLSWSRFFRNQEHLKEARVEKDLPAALKGAEALILAVPHKEYLNLNPDDILKWAGQPLAIIDCFGILTDDVIRRYFELGCEVKALGRGHIQRIKNEVRNIL